MATYDEVWTTPGLGSADSMPIGNGDIGANVWTEANGDVRFYLSKSDAWSENWRLLKLGKVRLSFRPNIIADAARNGTFEQRLIVETGELVISGAAAAGTLEVRIRVDANHPAVRIECSGTVRVEVTAVAEHWRLGSRELAGREAVSAYGLHEGPQPVVESGDIILSSAALGKDALLWAHRNPSSLYRSNMELQGLGDVANDETDPMRNLTFGVAMFGERFVKLNNVALMSAEPAFSHRLTLVAVAAQTETLEQWSALVGQVSRAAESRPGERALADHRAWWRAFWERSWIRLSGCQQAETVSRAYALQRYMFACAGRGQYPIKFNGSLFTFDADLRDYPYDIDFRMWGGPYWFQNSRLLYWPMLACGDADLFEPFLRMYEQALPTALARTRIYFGHEGAFFPETMYPWGTYTGTNYGWDREGKPLSYVANIYIRHYWQGNLELSLLLMEYARHLGDRDLFRQRCLPVITAILAFYDKHYPRDVNGKLRIEPAQSLETWHEAVNPLPDVAGLKAVISALLGLPDGWVDEADQAAWSALCDQLPPLPMDAAQRRLLPAASWTDEVKNGETPELYAVFPYPLFGAGKPDVDIGRNTYHSRRVKQAGCWSQDAIQAACLGLADEAARDVVVHFTNRYEKARFPAFWGPNFDWAPDQDNGGAGMLALQKMLLHTDGDKLLLLPAWPEGWDADFKLHAPGRTTVTGSVRAGKLVSLVVDPAERVRDVIICEERER
ncbi:MAG: hypothetical protein J7639_20885 [Paenibacillaceae bacterium]|nr:hypothetical protein [Paenibacillaceae bacterium]